MATNRLGYANRAFPKTWAWLAFYGKKAVAKEAFAQYFLAWILCANRHANNAPCGECGSCLWLKSDTIRTMCISAQMKKIKKQNAKIKIEKNP